MDAKQQTAAKSLKRALGKVRDAGLTLRVYDGGVWVCPEDVDLWPNGDAGDPIGILNEHGVSVAPPGLNADGGAGS